MERSDGVKGKGVRLAQAIGVLRDEVCQNGLSVCIIIESLTFNTIVGKDFAFIGVEIVEPGNQGRNIGALSGNRINVGADTGVGNAVPLFINEKEGGITLLTPLCCGKQYIRLGRYSRHTAAPDTALVA
jgi:hypothetical protein